MKKSILSLITLCLGLSIQAQSDAELVTSTVVKADIESHIYFLASDEMRGRQTGSNECKIASSYLANHLRKYGVKPAGENGTYYQNVPLETVTSAENIQMKINDLTGDQFLAMSVRNFDFSGDAIYLDYGSKEDFEGADVKGKLVVVKAGTSETKDVRAKYRAGMEKREMAKEAGAAGLVELVELDEKMWDRYSHYFNDDKTGLKSQDKEGNYIHLWMVDKGMSGAASLEKSKSIKAEIKIEGIQNIDMLSRNVVGYLEGTDPKLKDEFIIYSAHYDHIGVGVPNAENDSIYNGARDNAVGTVTVLSAAENIGKYPTKRSSLFILFTGEEKGLLGSKYYSENPMMPLNKMVYCFNSDNGGYNDTSKVTIFGLNRTTVAQHIIDGAKEFGLEAIDDPAPEQNLFDRSDNVNFAKKGVPAPTYSMGFTSFDEAINKTYHQVTDNPETIDFDYLEKFFRAYVLTCRMISDDPETPFWTEGDKYYEAGVELYKEKAE